MNKRIFQLTTVCASAVLLSSCITPQYRSANKKVAQTQANIQNLQTQQQKPMPAVVNKSGYYVDDQPISLHKPAAWLSHRITMRAHNMPLNILMSRLLRGTGVNVTYDNSVQAQQPVSLNYTGTVQGALQNLAANSHYFYSLNKKELLWSAFETKTFDISFMPGASNYMVGQSQGGSNNSSEGYGLGQVVGQKQDDQYSNLEGRLSVWQDLERTLNDLKSPEGRVVVSESTTTVTVHDHPQNVRAMAQYIKQLNKTLSQEVGIRVEVLEVDLNNNSNYGINWNAVAHTLDTTMRLTGDFANATNLVANNITSNAGFQIGKDEDQTLLNAISQQGKLRIVTRPQVVTMNNQIAAIRITRNTGYIQNVSTTNSNYYSSTAVTPGTVTSGLTLYILPKIQHNKVYMQISSNMSDLVKLDKESAGPTTTNTENNNNNNNEQNSQQSVSIQLPTTTQKSFNQRSVVHSGSTLIIAGYNQLKDQTSQSSFFTIGGLGSKGTNSQDVQTIVLITPTILKGSNQ